ncbi:MAG: MATE family efflux transporter [Lachnospiraceae bacterium]|nr:MATE family efflux transporter [Lachnospiraceae bacterium]
MAGIRKDFTEGSIPKQLFAFMLPFMLSNALQVLYSVVDMIIVGQFVGKSGLAAVAQGSQIVNFAVMFFMGFSQGGQTLIAQTLGAGKKERLNKEIGTLFTAIFLLGCVFTVILVLPREGILTLINMPEEGFDMAMSYVLICGGGLIFTAGYNCVSSVLRGMGDSKRPFIFITISSVVNLILDLLFTGAWGWGVPGAAAATIIGQAVSFIISIIHLYKKREAFGFDFKLSSFKMDRGYLATITKQGIPQAVQNAIVNISMVFVSAMVNSIGVTAAATFGVGIKIDDVCTRISVGVQFATAPMIGQNYAAKKFDRVKKTVYWSWIFAGIYTAVFIAYYLPFGDTLFALFTSDADVIAMSSQFRYAIFVEFIFLVIMRGTNGLLQGIGYANLSLILGIIDGVVLRIGLSWLLGIVLGWGFVGFVLGFALAPFGIAIPGLVYFISGRWKTRKALVD